jgi:sugar transferase (PEP-CTERM/EpsH1 system associated)
MRILWAKADLLLPLETGGKLRTWHLLRHLARRHEITYVGFGSPAERKQDLTRMSEVARDLHVVPHRSPAKRSIRFYFDALWRLADPLPYAVGKYRSREYRHTIERLLNERSFDILVCDFLAPAVNLPSALSCPAVIFMHNVESEIWRRYVSTARNPVLAQLYALQYRRMLRFEHQALARFDGVLAVSDADRDTFQRLYPSAPQPVVIPTGVDTAFFAPSPTVPARRSLVFTGSMDWLPNEDAMLFFCREILPLIRREEPDAVLTIVGRAPTAPVRRLAEAAGVVITGRVDDVRPPMASAAVYVVPLRIGGGTRLKIFEAMAMGKAVVSTTVGAEGLPVRSGEHLLIADEPDTFASAVVRLMRDVEERHRLESAARRLVLERYDWRVAASRLEDALLTVAGRQAADAAPVKWPMMPAVAPPPGESNVSVRSA